MCPTVIKHLSFYTYGKILMPMCCGVCVCALSLRQYILQSIYIISRTELWS